MRPWHHGVMSLRLIFSGALFFLRQWILLPATLGLLEAGAAQRVANTSLNMPLDLPDGSFEVVDAVPGLRFSNPGSGELSWKLEFDSKATSNALGMLMANSSEKKDEKGLLCIPMDFSKYRAVFFKMMIDWPEAPNAEVEP